MAPQMPASMGLSTPTTSVICDPDIKLLTGHGVNPARRASMTTSNININIYINHHHQHQKLYQTLREAKNLIEINHRRKVTIVICFW